jgi:hypothetical protein
MRRQGVFRALRPSPAMVVAVISLVVAIGGTAVALPGKRTVGPDDLKNGSVGARALAGPVVSLQSGLRSIDLTAGDGNFTEADGVIRCPARAPFAFDPSIGNMGPRAFEVRRTVIPNRWGGPGGYEFRITTDEGPDIGYTMRVNCLPRR